MRAHARTHAPGRSSLAGYLFAAPWMIGLFLFVLVPVVATLLLGFTNYNMINRPRWLGLLNYKIMFFLDPYFWVSLYNTFYYMIGSVFLKVALALVFAVLLNLKGRPAGILRTVYFLPVVLPGIPVMLLWLMILNPTHGLINRFLAFFGIQGPLWLLDPVWSKPAIILMSLWSIGGIIVLFLAGLQDIPEDLYEAADLEGASQVRKFLSITIPLLAPVILFNLVTGFIGASQVFTEAYVLTGGGPLSSTTFINYSIYISAFKDQKMGYASAMAWMMFLILVPITLALFRVYRKRFEI